MLNLKLVRGRVILATMGILLLGGSGLAKQAASGEAVVTIDSFQFQPKKISVHKGDVVTFTNHDAAPHTVSPSEGANFTGTGRLLKNESKSVQFNDVGTQNYCCDFHPSMKGIVIVVDK